MSDLAAQIFRDRYAHDVHGRKETWRETSYRVATHVMAAVNAPREIVCEVAELMAARILMSGGRYLAATGRAMHQTQNCVLLRAEDTREGWAKLLSNSTMALMTGAGVGVNYSALREEGALLKRAGGYASGPIALVQAINEVGRAAKSGGSRRAALWAGLRWSHGDALKFANLKDWAPEVRAAKVDNWNYAAPFDHTNISLCLDDEFFTAIEDTTHPRHAWAREVYATGVHNMVSDAEPGFAVDVGDNAGEDLRNAPVCAGTHVLTDKGYKTVGSIVDQPATVWTGKRWAEGVVFKRTAENAEVVKVTLTGGRVIRCEPSHEFLVEQYEGRGERRRLVSVDRVPASQLEEGDTLHVSLPSATCDSFCDTTYMFGLVYGDGHIDGRRAELTLCTPEKKALRQYLPAAKVSSVTEDDSRGYDRVYFKSHQTWAELDKAHIPPLLSGMSSFIAGLFDADGNVYPEQGRVRLSNNSEAFLREVARELEALGILASVGPNGHSTYGDKQTYQLVVMGSYVQDFFRLIPVKRLSSAGFEGFKPYRESRLKVLSVESDGHEDVFCADVRYPEHSFMAEGVIISNCTEVTSYDDSDICNLASLNMARITSVAQMRRAVELGTMFLLAGTVYSDIPYDEIGRTRAKNRRLGLGLMGVHEWLLINGLRYEPTDTLIPYLDAYAESTRIAAYWADYWGLSRPVKTRAIAPTGTIGIVAETTTGLEPIFCPAYQRAYYDHGTWRTMLVIDPTAKRLVSLGIDPDDIEDAMVLARDVERRLAFQAWIQRWVDHGISSTINLPAWGSEHNNPDTEAVFAKVLLKYLPHLRGITCYPDGSRGGQPITPKPYREVARALGVLEDVADMCSIRGGGSCGV